MEHTTVEQAREAAKNLTLEDMWVMIIEDRKRVNDYFDRLESDRKEREKRREKEKAEEKARAEAEKAEAEKERKKRDREREKAEKERRKAEKERRKEEKERAKRAEKEMADLRKEFGRIGIAQGDQIEAMFTNLWLKFNALGFHFEEEAPNVKFLENNQIIAEVDYLLQNKEYVLAVEVKAKLTKTDIDRHIKRLTTIKQYRSKRGDTRNIIGAVAGAVVAKNTVEYAQKKGLYVLVQNGDAVSIANPHEGFIVKKW